MCEVLGSTPAPKKKRQKKKKFTAYTSSGTTTPLLRIYLIEILMWIRLEYLYIKTLLEN
jgi:hypothetical protein